MKFYRFALALISPVLIHFITQAQVDLISGPINSSNAPVVTIPVKVQCDFVWQENLDVNQFTVTEDGIFQSPLSLSCPPLNSRSAIAVSMVGDRRSAMPAFAIVKMRNVYKAFVSGFKTWSGIPDKGNVFGDPSPTVSLTSDKIALNNGISLFDNSGSFSLSVITNAINDLLNNAGAVNKYIVITATGDQLLYPTPAEIIAINIAYNAAKAAGVKFYVVIVYTNPLVPFIGSIVDQLLKQFTGQTGGLYYLAKNQDEMHAAYRELMGIIFTEVPACTLSYTSKVTCPDGGVREVIVTWTGCSNSSSDTLSYTAPNDPSQLRSASFTLQSDTINALDQKQIAFELSSPLPEVVLYPFSVTLRFDPTYLKLTKVETQGDLAEGFTPTITANAQGAKVDFAGPAKLVSGKGVLCHFTFTAGDPDNDITVPIQIQSVIFVKGCLKPVAYNNGSITILARRPILNLLCQFIDAVVWDSTTFTYNPETFNATVTILNSGNREAKNVEATIVLPTGLELVTGSLKVKLNPSTLNSGTSSDVTWVLKATERITSDSHRICIQVTSDNHPLTECCKKIFVQERGPLLSLKCSSDVITIDKNKYSPMPFTFRTEVTNIGGMIAQPTIATIVLPVGLSLAIGEQATKYVMPSILRNNQTGSVDWKLIHPESPTDLFYDIIICVNSPKTKEACCTLQVKIPGINAPLMQTTCLVPDSLLFNPIANEYNPNPFTVSIATKNVGGLDAENVRAIIILPPEFVLEPPTQKDTVVFNPSTISNNPNDPPVTASWQVRALKQSSNKQVIIRFKIIGQNFGDVDCEKLIKLPKAGIAQLSCKVIAPDSLSVSSNGSDYTPNPFQVDCIVKNSGSVVSGNLIATILLPSGLTSQSPLFQIVGSGILSSNEQQQSSWTISADPSSNPQLHEITVNVYEDSINVTTCADTIRIPKLNQLLRATCLGPDTIKYDRSSGVYSPDPFIFDIRVANNGGVEAHNVEATIILPPELQLLSGAQTITVAPSIQPLQIGQNSWMVKVNPQSSGVSVQIIVRVTADGIAPFECRKTLVIEGESLAQLSCNLSMPSKITFVDNGYQPNPFLVVVHIKNTGAISVSNISALLITPSDIAIDYSDVSLKPVYPITLDPGDSTTVSFMLRVYPHVMSRTDTIRVSLITSQAPPIICSKIIDVDKALKPQFDIQCLAVDSVKYDAVTRKFIPDPFSVTVNIRNGGDAAANNVYGIISLSRGLSLNDVVQKFLTPTTLLPNQNASVSWSISALKNISLHVDSIFITIRTDDFGIVESKCLKVVYVQAVSAPLFQSNCYINPDSVGYNNGRYVPEEVTFNFMVKNLGNAASIQTNARIILPTSLKLAPLEQAVKLIGNGTLDPNPNRLYGEGWQLTIVPRTSDERAKVCVVIYASNADTVTCCAEVFIPGKNRPSFSLQCAGPTALSIDTVTGSYIPTPFPFMQNIENTSNDVIDTLHIEVILPSGVSVSGNGSTNVLRSNVLSNEKFTSTFNLLATPRIQGDTLTIISHVYGSSIIDQYCIHKIFIPGITNNAILSLLCDAKIDTITYITQTNTTQPSLLSISSSIINLKNTSIAKATAEIFLPAGLTLANGETVSHNVTNILPGIQNAQNTFWNITAARPTKDTIVSVTIRVTVDGSTTATCEHPVQLLIRTDVPNVFLNQDEVVIAGESIDIPVWIDSRGTALRDASINIKYDAKLLRLLTIGLLDDMRTRWLTPIWTESLGSTTVNLQSIGDFTSDGKIFYIRFGANEFSTDKQFDIITTLLNVNEGLFNDRKMRATTTSRTLTITGRCATPLNASSKFQLMQNIPNPANPMTRIDYQLPYDTHVHFTIHDMYGRTISIPIDEVQSKGMHSIAINTGSFTSGLYFYRLQTSAGVLMRKMMVVVK